MFEAAIIGSGRSTPGWFFSRRRMRRLRRFSRRWTLAFTRKPPEGERSRGVDHLDCSPKPGGFRGSWPQKAWGYACFRTNRHLTRRLLSVPADIQSGGKVAGERPLRVSDALSVRTTAERRGDLGLEQAALVSGEASGPRPNQGVILLNGVVHHGGPAQGETMPDRPRSARYWGGQDSSVRGRFPAAGRLTGAGREVTDGDAQPDRIRQLLHGHLPQPAAVAITPPRIGRDQQPTRVRIERRPHLAPPAADGLRGELRRIVVDAHAHPPLVVRQVVNPRRRHLPQALVREVLGPDLLGGAGGPPLLPSVLEIPDQLPLFRVHGHGRLPRPLEGTHLPVDVLELGVAIRMRRPFPGLAVGLEAVIQIVEQGGYRPVADAMASAVEFLCQVTGALARPAERGLRVAARSRFDEGFQVLDQGGVRRFQEGPASPGLTAAFGREGVGGHVLGVPELAQAGPDGRPGQAGGLSDQRDAATLEGHGFASGPMASQPFVHQRPQQFKLAPHGFEGGVSVHAITLGNYHANCSSNCCPVPEAVIEDLVLTVRAELEQVSDLGFHGA